MLGYFYGRLPTCKISIPYLYIYLRWCRFIILKYLMYNWACLSRLNNNKLVSCFFRYIVFEISMSNMEILGLQKSNISIMTIRDHTRRAWIHVIEISESICCFFGCPTADKNSTYLTHFGNIADSVWPFIEMIDQAQLICFFCGCLSSYKKLTSCINHSLDIRLSRILQFDWSRSSWATPQDMGFVMLSRVSQ